MIQNELAQGSWVDQVASWSSIVSAAVAVAVVALGILASSTFYQTFALLNRRRKAIGPAVRDVGMCPSWLSFIRTGRLLLSRRVRSGDALVREELAWLSGLNPMSVAEEGLSETYPVRIPFTFADHIVKGGYSSTLGRLSDAYAAYASSLRRRWLLRSTAGPLVALEHGCARATADLLQKWASFEPISLQEDPCRMRGRLVTLAPAGGTRSIRLVTWPDMSAVRAAPGFPVTSASYQPYRVVMEGSPARGLRSEPEDVRVVRNVLGTATSNPLTFDGVLPRWHGPGFRLELDRITGRQKLHLCVAETTYFAFRATQEPDAAALSGDAALCARLLGLNLLALDQEDAVVLVRRSGYVVYPESYAGTVSGNCELAPREGLAADLDEHGLPDLLTAIAREAREELGLNLAREDAQLSALGVIEYNGESELESHALVATARLPGRASEFRIERSAPDPVEGLWELGNDFMTIDLAAVLKDKHIAHRFVMWLRRSDNLAPQAAGSLLLLLTARIELRQHQEARARRNHQHVDSVPWTTCELAQWLDDELPKVPVDISDIAHHYPLWA
jgi:8-oxo-dGTP pyrophosphatase MutT (NUDIX family)